ncbi:helix-turn-helix domain containing protein [Paenibacillus sp. SI8]|uniref:helix-turn-helix domain containing protein n=1 Tax=unclassified Paenibacillus TaxID=185978 RepID=UPI003466BE68
MQERLNLYIACEEMNMIWDDPDVLAFESMWKEGLSIDDIAKSFGRDIDEVALLVMDRARKGYIGKRPNGAYGRRTPA